MAFALDGTSVELAFVIGPLLLSALLLVGAPALPLLFTAGLLAVGGSFYCLTKVARSATPDRQRQASGHDPQSATAARIPLLSARVVAVLAVMVMLSVGFGQLDTSIAATADRALGGTEKVGVLFAAIAGGSAVGGLTYGSRSWPWEDSRAVPVLLGLFGLFLGLTAWLLSAGVAQLPILLPIFFLTGITIAPTLIMQQSLLDRYAPPDRLNEAQALLSASNTTGAAVGTAVAGITIDAAGLSWSFAGAAVGAALAAAIALASQSHWRASVER